jgi:very-short-patch-repair endonuclease
MSVYPKNSKKLSCKMPSNKAERSLGKSASSSKRTTRKKTVAEILFEKHLAELGCEFVSEYRFHPLRKWRFDWALPEYKLAIEQEGGIWTGGRHTRGKGYQQDLNKYNHAVMLGWKVLRFSVEDIRKGTAKAFLKEYL